MAFNFAIYDWSLYTLPPAIPMSDIEGDTHSNDPASPDYSPAAPSWIGETFTFNGGDPTAISVDDDDGNFEDGYVETGAAQTLAEDVTIGDTTYLAGSVVENEFSLLDADGREIWVVRIDGVNVGFTYVWGDAPEIGETFTPTKGRDGDPADSGDGESTTVSFDAILCYSAGAMILTPDGERAVESLRRGDLVQTVDCGAQPIRWVSCRQLNFVGELDKARPVLIAAGAFGPGLPRQDLCVSPQHRFLFHLPGHGGAEQVLVPAKALTKLPRVRVMRGKRAITYYHLLLERHELLTAAGVISESCYLGGYILQSVPIRERWRLAALFPQVDLVTGRGYGDYARPVLKVRETQQLLAQGQLHFLPPGEAGGSGTTGSALRRGLP